MVRRRVERSLPDSTLYSREYLLSSALDGLTYYEAGGLSVVRRREIDLLGIAAGDRVLDLGCGRGETCAELARRGGRPVAIDYSWDAVVLTREHVAARVPVAQASGVQLPFVDGSFDRVLMSDVVEHVPWPMAETMLNEVHRVLAPGGRALIHTAPNTWFIAVVKRPLVVLLRLTRRRPALDRFREYDRLRDAMHPNELSPLSFRRLMKRTKFASVTWVDRDVLRSGSSEWTNNWPRPLVSLIAGIAGAWPLRLLLGNDMYSLAVVDSDQLADARRRIRRSSAASTAESASVHPVPADRPSPTREDLVPHDRSA